MSFALKLYEQNLKKVMQIILNTIFIFDSDLKSYFLVRK